jgi:glycosyltransferase involved in cell wall biosynthesis
MPSPLLLTRRAAISVHALVVAPRYRCRMIGRSGLIRVPSATVRKLAAIGGHFGFYWDLLRIHDRSVTLYSLQPTVHLQRLMAEAEILVDPSNADTYAVVTVAAMVRGCALIASDLEPLPQVVPDEEAGLLTRRCDAGGVTSKLLELAEDEPPLGQLRGEPARSTHVETIPRWRVPSSGVCSRRP